MINLALSKSVTVDAVAGLIPSESPRYSIFNYKHNHEGDNLESIVFVYSCPGYQCPIKERMLYSTAKAPLIDAIEALGINLIKKASVLHKCTKHARSLFHAHSLSPPSLPFPCTCTQLEIGEGSEFTGEWLSDQLHPVKTVFKPKFARPSRPGRGGRRLTRRGTTEQDGEEEEEN